MCVCHNLRSRLLCRMHAPAATGPVVRVTATHSRRLDSSTTHETGRGRLHCRTRDHGDARCGSSSISEGGFAGRCRCGLTEPPAAPLGCRGVRRTATGARLDRAAVPSRHSQRGRCRCRCRWRCAVAPRELSAFRFMRYYKTGAKGWAHSCDGGMGCGASGTLDFGNTLAIFFINPIVYKYSIQLLYGPNRNV